VKKTTPRKNDSRGWAICSRSKYAYKGDIACNQWPSSGSYHIGPRALSGFFTFDVVSQMVNSLIEALWIKVKSKLS